ncbi:hypothetical protein GGF41_001755 [Coemansia sp. RSA 2531]|nr:hypothetical protein GGF41_001755 [Coemansia sp. RSA 2531]
MEGHGPIVMAWIHKNVGTQCISFSMEKKKIHLKSSIGDIKRRAQTFYPVPLGGPIVAFIDVDGLYPYNVDKRPAPFDANSFSTPNELPSDTSSSSDEEEPH